MTPPNNNRISMTLEASAMMDLVDQINQTLETYSDKEWNYSRINLVVNTLDNSRNAYALALETLDIHTVEGKSAVKRIADEISWGERHSSELGILELISLRVNKALMNTITDESWGGHWPVVRVVRKEELEQKGVAQGLWYEVHEVAGDEFDTR